MNALLNSVSAQDLRRAAEIKDKIDSLQAELASILGSESVASPRNPRVKWARTERLGTSGRKRGMKRSAAARARLSAIARERWRKVKAAGKKSL